MPFLGKTVLYTLTEEDADRIKLVRDTEAPLGRRGNPVAEGQQCKASIVRVFGSPTPTSSFNIQVELDGNDSYWVTSTLYGDGPGRCRDTAF